MLKKIFWLWYIAKKIISPQLWKLKKKPRLTQLRKLKNLFKKMRPSIFGEKTLASNGVWKKNPALTWTEKNNLPKKNLSVHPPQKMKWVAPLRLSTFSSTVMNRKLWIEIGRTRMTCMAFTCVETPEGRKARRPRSDELYQLRWWRAISRYHERQRDVSPDQWYWAHH